MMTKIYPRTGDKQTVYLNAVIKDPQIEVGDYTIYNDFVADPLLFEKNNVLYHYPIHREKLIIGKFCSIACGTCGNNRSVTNMNTCHNHNFVADPYVIADHNISFVVPCSSNIRLLQFPFFIE